MATYQGNKDIVLGSQFLLYLYDESASATPIAYSTSASLQIDGETIEANSKFSCSWKNNMLGNLSYSISSDALYTQTSGLTSFDSLMAAMVGGKTLKWAMGPEAAHSGSCETNEHLLDTSAVYYEGQCVVTSLSLNASVDEIASCSISLQGSGPLEQKNTTGVVVLKDYGE